MSAKSQGEENLAMQIKVLKLPAPDREHRFHPTRRWRFDFAWPALKFAVEVEGGVYSNGRHTRGKGFEEDCIKYAEAAVLGWTVIRFSTGQVNKGIAHEYISKIILQNQ